MKSKGYEMMHEVVGDDRPISEAERRLLATFSEIRRAEWDTDYAYELDIWSELQMLVGTIQTGAQPRAEYAEGLEIAQAIAKYIERRRAERTKDSKTEGSNEK